MLNKRCLMILYILISIYFIYPDNQQYEIKYGFGGYSVPGYWAPLYIKINQNIKSGRIEIERKNNSNIFSKEIFPCSKNNTIECPVLFDENIASIVIRLYSYNELLIERTINIDEKIFPGHIILTNGMNSMIQQSIARSLFPEEPVQVISINLEDLPTVGINYDCVTALVISDPGILLNPSQLNALKYWISGGGQIVVFDLLSESNTILNKLGGEVLSSNKYKVIGSGYGKIFGFNEDAESSDIGFKSSEWQKLLELKPYGQNPRLTASKILKSEENIVRVKFNYSFLRTIILICTFSWAIMFFLILFFKKKNILILSIFTIISFIIFIPFGNVLKKKWQGGSAYHNRMIILPGNNGFLINSRIWFPNLYSNDFYLKGIDINFGVSEKAILNPRTRNSSILVHNINKPGYILKRGANDSIEIVAYQSFNNIENKFLKNILLKNDFKKILDIKGIDFQQKENLVLVKGKNRDLEWWVWDIINYKWKKEKDSPEWLNNDLEWITSLKKNRIDADLLIGFDNINGLNITLQDESCTGTLWVILVKS